MGGAPLLLRSVLHPSPSSLGLCRFPLCGATLSLIIDLGGAALPSLILGWHCFHSPPLVFVKREERREKSEERRETKVERKRYDQGLPGQRRMFQKKKDNTWQAAMIPTSGTLKSEDADACREAAATALWHFSLYRVRRGVRDRTQTVVLQAARCPGVVKVCTDILQQHVVIQPNVAKQAVCLFRHRQSRYGFRNIHELYRSVRVEANH